MTFNPKEPRDAQGRWTHLAGLMKTAGGFTALMSGGEATKGYAVAVPSKDGKDWRSLPHGSTSPADLQRFADDYKDVLSVPHRAIGGWSNDNPEYGEVRDALDVVEVYDDVHAATAAAENARQDAIFDLEHGEEISLRALARTADVLMGPAGRKETRKMDLSILTPSFNGVADLSVQDGKLAFWKQVLPKKVIHYTAKDGTRRTLDFNERYLQDLANNQAVDKVGFLLADKDNAHTMDPERFRGSIAEWQIRDGESNPDHNGLYAKIVFPTKEAARAVLDNPDLGVSARIRENIARSDGSSVSRGIIHVLGTLDPQVSGMSPWQTADLANEDGDTVLDLTTSTFEDKTMAFDPKAPLDSYSEDDIAAFTDEEIDSYLAACEEQFGTTLDEVEDELDHDEEGTQVTASLSNEMIQHQIDLANTRAGEALRRLAETNWRADRASYLRDGVPPALLDLAAPVLNRPDEMVIDLSHTDQDDVNVTTIVRGLLDAAKGTIDLSEEAGHGGAFVPGSGEDPDAEGLALWDASFGH